jgi:RecA/RadA recombinase
LPKKTKATAGGEEPLDPKQAKRELLRKSLKGLRKASEVNFEHWVHTGMPEIDAVLSEGEGIPLGIVMEVCGFSQSAKTYLCYCIIAAAQKAGHLCGFANVENGYYNKRAKQLGIDTDQLDLLEECISAEEYADGIVAMVKSGIYGIIVVDSIGAMVPQDELDKDYGDAAKIGTHATFVKKLTNELNQLCPRHKCTVIFINHFKTGAGVMKGTFEDKPTGGRSLESNSRIRLWLKRLSGKSGMMIDAKGKRIGGYSECKLMKANFGGQDEIVMFPVKYVEADCDPIGEFAFKVKAQSEYDAPSGLKGTYQFIKGTAKKPQVIKYANPETGEVEIETDSMVAFIRAALNTEAPAKFVKAGKGETVLDYLGSKIKLYEAQKRSLIEALDAPEAIALPQAEVSEEDMLDGGLDLNAADETGAFEDDEE